VHIVLMTVIEFSCEDEMLNNGESDVDCGGGNCEARCSSGKTCRDYSDCKSGVCTSSICRMSSQLTIFVYLLISFRTYLR
jgi:hypothetical protein